MSLNFNERNTNVIGSRLSDLITNFHLLKLFRTLLRQF